eukprot:869348-Pleurochrysis_carterae.AAC.1
MQDTEIADWVHSLNGIGSGACALPHRTLGNGLGDAKSEELKIEHTHSALRCACGLPLRIKRTFPSRLRLR